MKWLMTFFFSCSLLWLSAQSGLKLLEDLYAREQYEEVVIKSDSLLQIDAEYYARIYQIKADAYYFLNDIPSSLSNYLKAIAYHDVYPLNDLHLLECYSHTGFCHKYLGQYKQALSYYLTAYDMSVAMGDSVEIANQASNVGVIYSELGKYEAALRYLNEAYTIDFALHDEVALAYDQANLANLLTTIGDYDHAIAYLRESLKQQETIQNDHTPFMKRLGKLADAFLKANQLDSSKKYIKLAIEEAKLLEAELDLANMHLTKANIFINEGKYDSAYQLANSSYQFYKKESKAFQAEAAFQIARIFAAKNNFKAANEKLEEALRLAKLHDNIELTGKVLQLKSRIETDLNRPEQAIRILEEYHTLEDTLLLIQKQKAVLVLEQEYLSKEREQKIELLEAQNRLAILELDKKRRGNIILITILIASLIIVSIVIYMLRKKSRLEKQLLTSEINELRLQIKQVMGDETPDVQRDALNQNIQDSLSEREFEILKFALSDLSNSEIAEKAFVSVNTVKFHLKNIYGKLGVTNRKEALRYAMQAKKD